MVMACGVENMTRVPIGSDAVPANKKMGKPVGRSYFEQREFTSQFEAAERLAEKYQLTRSDTDNFGLQSQMRAKAAIENGHFDSQIIPIEAPEMDDDFERENVPSRIVDFVDGAESTLAQHLEHSCNLLAVPGILYRQIYSQIHR